MKVFELFRNLITRKIFEPIKHYNNQPGIFQRKKIIHFKKLKFVKLQLIAIIFNFTYPY